MSAPGAFIGFKDMRVRVWVGVVLFKDDRGEE